MTFNHKKIFKFLVNVINNYIINSSPISPTNYLSNFHIYINKNSSIKPRKTITFWVWFWPNSISSNSILHTIFSFSCYLYRLWHRNRPINSNPTSNNKNSIKLYYFKNNIISTNSNFWSSLWMTRRIPRLK